MLVEADKAKIHQVLVNLIVNAIKYGKVGGSIRVKFFDMDKNILTEIADDGEGIAEEHLPRLFERFYRTDAGRSRDSGWLRTRFGNSKTHYRGSQSNY